MIFTDKKLSEFIHRTSYVHAKCKIAGGSLTKAAEGSKTAINKRLYR